MSQLGTKIALFKYFWAIILKDYCHIWNHHPWIYLSAQFCKKTKTKTKQNKTKMFKYGTKKSLFGYFWFRCYLKLCCIWNQHCSIWLIGKYCKKPKLPKVSFKNSLFGCFSVRFFKISILSFLKSAPQTWLIGKLCQNTKMSKFGTKNALFGYLWAGFKKKKINFPKNQKWPKFRTKISLFGYIRVRLFKNPIFLILKSAPWTLSN